MGITKSRLLLALVFASACVAPFDNSSARDRGESQEREELVEYPDANSVVTSRKSMGVVETTLGVDGEIVARSWYRSTDNTADYVILDVDQDHLGKGYVRDEASHSALSMQELNSGLVKKWREHHQFIPGYAAYDDPGCDVVDRVFAGDDHCVQNACAYHDQCYAQYGCTAASFINPSSNPDPVISVKCNGCNFLAEVGIGTCALEKNLPDSQKTLRADTVYTDGKKFNPCGAGEHLCYDVNCKKGPEDFYCRANCYTEPSPCEAVRAAQNGQTWCEDTCRDGNGRKGFAADSCSTALSSCACPTIDPVDGRRGRCSDASCTNGRNGFCVSSKTPGCGTNGNVLESPCCGDLKQACCTGGGSPCGNYPGTGTVLSCTSGLCTCTPNKAACFLVSCGTASDGCGGTISCGSCANGQTCSAAGVCQSNGPACNSTQQAGSDAFDSKSIELGKNKGITRFRWNTVTVGDTIQIFHENYLLQTTGCQSTGNLRSGCVLNGAVVAATHATCNMTANPMAPGCACCSGGACWMDLRYGGAAGTPAKTSTKLRVDVTPNCTNGSSTEWNYSLSCPL